MVAAQERVPANSGVQRATQTDRRESPAAGDQGARGRNTAVAQHASDAECVHVRMPAVSRTSAAVVFGTASDRGRPAQRGHHVHSD